MSDLPRKGPEEGGGYDETAPPAAGAPLTPDATAPDPRNAEAPTTAEVPETATADSIQQVRDELAELNDLFKRRLLTDRDGQQKFDALYEQMTFARKGLVEDFVAPIVRELVLVIDRLEGMRAHVSAETAEALEGVQVELGEVLARRGVREVSVVGEPFDPRQHEAVERRVVDDPNLVGQVVEIRRAGYALEQRVVRPAQVVVGHRPAE